MPAEPAALPPPDLARHSRAFSLLVAAHVLGWTLVPALVRFQLPTDAAEVAVWARHLAWGYDRDPYLVAFVAAPFERLGRGSDLGLYVASQCAVAATLVLLWRLARSFFPPAHALVSVFLLEGLGAFNVWTVDRGFNDNVLGLPLWAGGMLAFRRAVTVGSATAWAWTGLLSGLAVMAKYYGLALLTGFLVFLLLARRQGEALRSRGFWAGAALFGAVAAPHVAWLFRQDFSTVRYMHQRMGPHPVWTDHVFNPLEFALIMALTLLGPMVLLFTVRRLVGRTPDAAPAPALAPADRLFLWSLGLGPLAGTILVSALTGSKLVVTWVQPALSLVGLLLVARFRPPLGPRGLRRFAGLMIGLEVLLLSAYSVSLVTAGTASRANFPARPLAESLQAEWRARFTAPLACLGGPRYLAAAVARYASDRPLAYLDWSVAASPWIDERALRETGAVFFWWPKDEGREVDLRRRFPRLEAAVTQRLPWMRGSGLPPVELRVAFLPPS